MIKIKYMKNLTLSLFCVSLIIALTSCKKEDNPTFAEVKGTSWKVHYFAEASGNFDLTFKTNGDIIYIEGDTINPAGTYTQSEDSVHWDFTTYGSGTYIYDGKLVENDSLVGKIRNASFDNQGTFTAGKR